MPDDTEQRKLAAIMFTDMVGYSALSQRDEKLAQELLEEHRQLLREIFPRFHGTEIKTIGDAFLVEFNSALEAAQCAIEIQRSLAKRDADATADRQIQIRIGIHIGDVVHRGGDVYGDGVNIASRIEPLADAGGICVSMDVERQIRNAVETRFEKLAPTELKNISVTMDLFRIVLPWEHKSDVTDQPARRSLGEGGKPETSARFPWHEIVIGILLLAALIGGAILWFHRAGPEAKTASGNPAAATASIPEKSIAVLPFANLSDDKQNAFFTDGVQDQILTALAKVADLKVISRTSVMNYKSDGPRNLREIGQQLGVAHLLEGSVQRAANKVRVNAQLIDARTDTHKWAENYDRPVDDVFAIQSEIATAIAAQLKAKLSPDEKGALEVRPTADLIAFDLYSRARNLMLMTGGNVTTDEKNVPQAIEHLNQAVARDPAFLLAHCLLAFIHDRLYFQSLDRTPARLAQAQAALDTAARLQPDAGETHLARAQHLYQGFRDYPGALAELDKAQQSLPNEARIFELRGYILRRQGKHEESLRFLERALELDPRNFITLSQIANSYNNLRRYPEAAAIYARALSIYPDNLDAKLSRAFLDINWKADTRPLRGVLDDLRQKDPAAFDERDNELYALGIYERNVPAAEAALKALGNDPTRDNALVYNAQSNAGDVARLAGNDEKARAAYVAAVEEQEKTVQAQPDAGPPLAVLGYFQALLGRKEEALRNGRRAMELLPVETDSINGPRLISLFAATATRVGEKDLALEHLARATQLPGGVSYGDLKLYFDWDPLRGDPRFEKIVQSLAPKDN